MVVIVRYTWVPYTWSSACTISAEVSAQARYLILLGVSFNYAAKSTLRSYKAVARLECRIMSRGEGNALLLLTRYVHFRERLC
jgi:hypothetical protein